MLRHVFAALLIVLALAPAARTGGSGLDCAI